MYKLNHYTVIKKDRPNQSAAGGSVAVLVKRDYVVDENSVHNLNTHGAQESVWFEVKIKIGKHIVLGTVYRAPSSSQENNDLICDLIRLSEQSTCHKQVVVTGDFNFRNILWEENRVILESQVYGQAQTFLETVTDNF